GLRAGREVVLSGHRPILPGPVAAGATGRRYPRSEPSRRIGAVVMLGSLWAMTNGYGPPPHQWQQSGGPPDDPDPSYRRRTPPPGSPPVPPPPAAPPPRRYPQ